MGWRDIIHSPDPSRALWLAMQANPSAKRAGDIFQGAFEGAMEGVGNIGRVLGAPARALNAAAYNTAVRPEARISPLGAALGRVAPAPSYGDLLAGTLEDAGEIAPNGVASKLLRLAGDAVTDPAMAPALLSGAEAVGALGGRLTPSAPPMRPTMPYRPRSTPQRPPAPAPRGGPPAPPPAAAAPATRGPYPPLGPTDTRPTSTVRGPLSGQTQPVQRFSPSGQPGWTQPPPPPAPPNPTATQPVRVPPGGGPQATQAFFPERTQPVPINPTATQRVPMVRRGKGPLRPKKTKASKED